MRKARFPRGGLLALPLIATTVGCAGNDIPVDAAPAEILSHAEERLAKGKYLDAVEVLEYFLRTYPGTALTPLAKLRLGDARKGMEEFVLAQGEYEDVVQDFPASAHVEEARFKIALCSYEMTFPYDRDQTETERTIRLLEDFRRDHPGSRFQSEADTMLGDCRRRLARREFEAGAFYEKQRRPRSAKIQYQYVYDHYPETEWARKGAFRIGELYRARGKWDRAQVWYRRVVETWPDSEEAAAARAASSLLATGEAVP